MSGIIGLKKWETAALENVSEIVSGSTPKTGVAEYWDGDIPWATPKDLSKLDSISIDSTEKRITERGLKSCSSRMLPAGSVLFSSRAPIGHVAINSVPMCTNQGFKSLIPVPSKLHNKFLYFWLRANREYLDGLGNGATFKEVSKKIVGSVEIPLPPLAEQKRLAAILDRADAVRRARRESLARMNELGLSLFLELFGDPARNPMGWAVSRLGDWATKFSDGPFGSNLKSSHYVDDGVRVVRLQNIGIGKFVDKDKAFVSQQHFDSLPRSHCRAGDVLVGTLGDPNLRACLLPPEIPMALNKADCVQMRVDETKALPLYVVALLSHPSAEQMAFSGIQGQTRLRISMGRLREMEFPLPPLPLQHQFAAQIEELETIKSRARASLTELDALFASLQSRAFSGELSGAEV